jgi:hypothetical protein
MASDEEAYANLDLPEPIESPPAPARPRRARRRLALACAYLTVVPALAAVYYSALCVWMPVRAIYSMSESPPAAESGSGDGADSLLVLAIGDWGGIGFFPFVLPAQLAVRSAMAKIARESSAPQKLVLALGDNFYFTGVAGVDDMRFKVTFEDVYVNGYPELSEPDMWRVVAGNRTRPSLDQPSLPSPALPLSLWPL